MPRRTSTLGWTAFATLLVGASLVDTSDLNASTLPLAGTRSDIHTIELKVGEKIGVDFVALRGREGGRSFHRGGFRRDGGAFARRDFGGWRHREEGWAGREGGWAAHDRGWAGHVSGARGWYGGRWVAGVGDGGGGAYYSCNPNVQDCGAYAWSGGGGGIYGGGWSGGGAYYDRVGGFHDAGGRVDHGSAGGYHAGGGAYHRDAGDGFHDGGAGGGRAVGDRR
jgi:hypothetical protein